MVRLRFALGTEILRTIVASNPKLSKVLGCLSGNWLTLVVFLAHLNFSRDHLHHISTWAANQTWVVFDKHHELALVNLLLILLGQELPALEIGHLLLAARAAY